MEEPREAITILLPVYGRSELLEPALASVLALDRTPQPWQLLIADDGSDASTATFLKRWLRSYGKEGVKWHRRPRNLGLFANLNQAVAEADTSWVLLLCSDDLLKPEALTRIHKLQQQEPEAGLIISTFDSINIDGSRRPADSAWHHDQISSETTLVSAERFIPALLELGSLNGNLSGMAFSRDLWQLAGPFRSDWRHAADWDWLIRASEIGPIVLNRHPIAEVRTHTKQLSNKNRKDGHELMEVASVVCKLRNHQLLAKEPKKEIWAARVMQQQLWNQLKQVPRRGLKPLLEYMQVIQKAADPFKTILAFAYSWPKRLRNGLLLVFPGTER